MPTEYELRMEQGFLACFWADPRRGLEVAKHCGGLTARDFWGHGHAAAFTYLEACAESHRTSDENEVITMSRATCGELSRERLRAIVGQAIVAHDDDAEHYAREVWECSQGRLTSEVLMLIDAADKEWTEFKRWLARGGWRAHEVQGRTNGTKRKYRGGSPHVFQG